LTGLTGLGLTSWGLRRLDAFGIAAATVGAVLLSRAVANIPITTLSVDAGHRVIRRARS